MSQRSRVRAPHGAYVLGLLSIVIVDKLSDVQEWFG
jgi:hypothetical protein